MPRTVQATNRVLNYKGKLLKQNVDTGGYLQVCLCNHTKRKTMLVHQLVLSAFVESKPVGLEACHNDGNRQNNVLSNLRWDTRSENTKDKITHRTHNWWSDVEQRIVAPR